MGQADISFVDRSLRRTLVLKNIIEQREVPKKMYVIARTQPVARYEAKAICAF